MVTEIIALGGYSAALQINDWWFIIDIYLDNFYGELHAKTKGNFVILFPQM